MNQIEHPLLEREGIEGTESNLPPIPECYKKTSSNHDRTNVEDAVRKFISSAALFSLELSVPSYHLGPKLYLLEVSLGRGTRVQTLESLLNDISLNMKRKVFYRGNIEGTSHLGIEVERNNPQEVTLGDIISRSKAGRHTKEIPITFGIDTRGIPVFSDISELNHLLVSGPAGSGKTNYMHAVLMTLNYLAQPTKVRLLIFDTKGIDYTGFERMQHLLAKVLTAPGEILTCLKWLIEEMNARLQTFAEIGSRDINSYNHKIESSNETSALMPRIIVFLDELTSLTHSSGEESSILLARICQKARACGIHVIATVQKASAENIASDLKAQFTSRLSFKQASHWDSRSIIDSRGAETLSLYGEALSTTPHNSDLLYSHIPLIKEVQI